MCVFVCVRMCNFFFFDKVISKRGRGKESITGIALGQTYAEETVKEVGGPPILPHLKKTEDVGRMKDGFCEECVVLA